jgi:hypothetical protein
VAIIPKSNLSGLPQITAQNLKDNDPSVLNRTLRLFATQLQGIQTGKASGTTVTNITQNISGGGGGAGGGGGGSSTPVATAVTLQGTHLERLTTLPASEAAGTYFYETDRTVTYLNFLPPSNVQVWQYVSGVMLGAFAVQPGDLGQYDTGFLFYATDRDLTYIWSGASWSIFNNFEPILSDTHANRLLHYPSVNFTLNTIFEETNRTVLYWVQNAVGTVNTTVSGTTYTVTWATGNHFINTGTGFTASQWPAGTPITINAVVYTVKAVASATSLTLNTTAGVQTGVAYSVASGRWVYLNGTYTDVYANKPTDLGENDYSAAAFNGFLFFAADYWRGFEWASTGAAPASASPGWGRSPGELPTAFVGILPFGGGQLVGGWQLCDGTTGVTITQDDATTTTVTAPNFIGAYAKGAVVASYSPTKVAAVSPTISGSTDLTTIGFNPASGAAAATGTPVTVQSGTGATVNSLTGGGGGGGGGSLVTDPHSHTLTAVTTSISGGDPVAHVVVPFFMKL